VPSSRTSVTVARSLVALIVAATLLSPAPSAAQEEGPDAERDQLRRDEETLVDIDVDPMRSDNSDVEAALGDIAANVEAQVQQLRDARAALTTADEDLAAADLAVAETQGQLDALTLQSDQVVIDAFMNPPAEVALDAFAAESLTDMSVKQSILNTKATSDAEVLDRYQQLDAQLETQKAERANLASTAEDNRDAAAAALADLESALSQQALFAIQVEERLDQRLAEVNALADIDPALAAQLQAREAELASTLSGMQEEARRIAAQENSAALAVEAEGNKGYGTIKEPPGGVVAVPCPAGGEIQVAGDIASQLTRLLQDAAAAGLPMCGGGYRDPADQIAVRRSNCGTSYYAIYEAPSSYCSPPTARPGTSMHEQGLAIDFTCTDGGSVGYGDSCHDWLRANAAEYGLYQLPSEPWHWSVSGE
jgi:hypothetical protein